MKAVCGWDFPKSGDFKVMAGAKTLSGRVFAGSLVPELKSGFYFRIV